MIKMSLNVFPIVIINCLSSYFRIRILCHLALHLLHYFLTLL